MPILFLILIFSEGIPLGIILAFRWSMGLVGLWIGQTVGLIYCASLSTFICLRIDWDVEMVKIMERLDKEQKQRLADMEGC